MQNDLLLAWLQNPSLVKFLKSHMQSSPSKSHILFRLLISQMPLFNVSIGQQSPPSKLQILMLFSRLQCLFPIAVGLGQQSLPSNSHSSLKLIMSHVPSSIKERFLHGEGGCLKIKNLIIKLNPYFQLSSKVLTLNSCLLLQDVPCGKIDIWLYLQSINIWPHVDKTKKYLRGGKFSLFSKICLHFSAVCL